MYDLSDSHIVTFYAIPLYIKFSLKTHFCFSVAGDVKFFDLRRNSSLATCETSQGMTAMAVHKAADTFAWYVKAFIMK